MRNSMSYFNDSDINTIIETDYHNKLRNDYGKVDTKVYVFVLIRSRYEVNQTDMNEIAFACLFCSLWIRWNQVVHHHNSTGNKVGNDEDV